MNIKVDDQTGDLFNDEMDCVIDNEEINYANILFVEVIALSMACDKRSGKFRVSCA